MGVPLEAIDDSTADELSRTENVVDCAAAIDALQRLPEKLRIATTLRVIHQLDYRQISEQMGCSPGNARIRVFRGLQQLARELQ